MDLIIDKKSVLIVSLGLLLLLSVWWMKPIAEELSSTYSVLSMTPLESVEEIVRQVVEERQSASSNSGGQNKPSLRDEIEKAKNSLSKSEYKAAKSNYKRMLEHIQKLEKYKKDPLKFDNKSFLKNAPNEQIRQKIIESRIVNLEHEIQTFYNNIVKIINH